MPFRGLYFEMDLFELAFIHCKIEGEGHQKSPSKVCVWLSDNVMTLKFENTLKSPSNKKNVLIVTSLGCLTFTVQNDHTFDTCIC